jgi:hypothetical protein
MMRIYFSFILCSSLLNWAHASVVNHFLLCKNKGQVRSVYVENSGDGGCKTYYTKSGRSEVIGSGIHLQSCVQFLNNVKTNLEGANWQCRAAAKAQVYTET